MKTNEKLMKQWLKEIDECRWLPEVPSAFCPHTKSKLEMKAEVLERIRLNRYMGRARLSIPPQKENEKT